MPHTIRLSTRRSGSKKSTVNLPPYLHRLSKRKDAGLLSLLLTVRRCQARSGQALISSLDKHIRGPRAGSRAVERIVIERRPLSLDLIECHVFFDHRNQALPNDGEHVSILHHIDFVADPPVPGNHHRAALIRILRDSEVDYLV